MSHDVSELLQQFVDVYNSGPDGVYALFAPELHWSEQPSGRTGGREALFAALDAWRDAHADGHLEVLNAVAGRDQGVLETILSVTVKTTGERRRYRVVWVLGFRKGKIVKEHDYSFLMD